MPERSLMYFFIFDTTISMSLSVTSRERDVALDGRGRRWATASPTTRRWRATCAARSAGSGRGGALPGAAWARDDPASPRSGAAAARRRRRPARAATRPSLGARPRRRRRRGGAPSTRWLSQHDDRAEVERHPAAVAGRDAALPVGRAERDLLRHSVHFIHVSAMRRESTATARAAAAAQHDEHAEGERQGAPGAAAAVAAAAAGVAERRPGRSRRRGRRPAIVDRRS